MYSPFIDLLNWIIWFLLICILTMFVIACFRLGGLIHYERAAQNIVRTTGYLPSKSALSHYQNGQLKAVPLSKLEQEKPTEQDKQSLKDTNEANYNRIMKKQATYRLNELDRASGYMIEVLPSREVDKEVTKVNPQTHQTEMKTVNGHQEPVKVREHYYVNSSDNHQLYGFGQRIPFTIQINVPINDVKFNDTSGDSRDFSFRATVNSETTSDLHNDMTN